MIVRNVQYYRNLPFEEYLKLPGLSFSGTKSNTNFQPSEGMRLGSLVHTYLHEPELYKWEQADKVLPIAAELRRYIGKAFACLEKEVSFTADFIYNGKLLKYKGRADMLKIGQIVVDLKILAGDLKSAIRFFGYDKQVSGYCIPTDCKLGLIISFNKSKKIVETQMIKPCEEFWQYQIVTRGTELYESSN